MAIQNYTYSYASDVQAEELSKAKTAAKAGAAGGSTMMKLALALGTIADNFVDKVLEKAKELDATSGKGGNENQLTAEMQALTQIMKSFMEAMNAMIKSMGEGNQSVARKG